MATGIPVIIWTCFAFVTLSMRGKTRKTEVNRLRTTVKLVPYRKASGLTEPLVWLMTLLNLAKPGLKSGLLVNDISSVGSLKFINKFLLIPSRDTKVGGFTQNHPFNLLFRTPAIIFETIWTSGPNFVFKGPFAPNTKFQLSHKT